MTTALPPVASRSASQSPMACSQGQRSSSVSGCPDAILATFAGSGSCRPRRSPIPSRRRCPYLPWSCRSRRLPSRRQDRQRSLATSVVHVSPRQNVGWSRFPCTKTETIPQLRVGSPRATMTGVSDDSLVRWATTPGDALPGRSRDSRHHRGAAGLRDAGLRQGRAADPGHPSSAASTRLRDRRTEPAGAASCIVVCEDSG